MTSPSRFIPNVVSGQGLPIVCFHQSIVGENKLNREGTNLYKSVQLLAYTDDIDIIDHNNRVVVLLVLTGKEAKCMCMSM